MILGLAYPSVFKYFDCTVETKGTRSDARDLHPGPDDRGVMDPVLQYCGWMKVPMDDALYRLDCVQAFLYQTNRIGR